MATKLFIPIALCAFLLLPQGGATAQNRNSGRSSVTQQNNHRSGNSMNRPGNQGMQPGHTNRPGNQGMQPGHSNRPGNQGVQPGHSNRPGNQGVQPGHSNRPGNQGVQPGHSNRPGNQGVQPGHSNRPGNQGVQPGHSNRPNNWNNGYRPGGNSVQRPGNNTNHYRPGGNSAPRPGFGQRPIWARPLPPAPPRPVYRPNYRPAPAITFGLGLAYGVLIDNALSSLSNAGYQIVSALDNAIYLQNVTRYGITWPEVTLYYNNGIMNGARYQYGIARNNFTIYNNVYNQLCAAYGMPINYSEYNGTRTATWWGSDGTGYVTLEYGPQYDAYGRISYSTSMTFGL